MHDFLDFFSINTTSLPDLTTQWLSKRKIDGEHRNFDGTVKDITNEPRSYYSNVPTPFIPAFDPISVLASLAFLAFLLQSFAALFDRTRSIIPTIISSRQSNSEYGERFVDTEKRVLRALEEYASLSNDLLDNERKNKKSTL